MMLRRVLAALFVLALLGASCNGDDDDDATPTTTTSTTAASTTTAGDTDDTALDCEPAGDTATHKAEATGDLLFVGDVQVGTGPEVGCVEQVVFTFEEIPAGSQLGYEIGYATGPFEDPSGRAASVEGEAFLRIVMLNGTTVDLSGDEPRETYVGTPTIPAGVSFIADLVKVSDFEGVSEWVIGLDARRPFTAEYDEAGPSFLVTISAA